MNLDYLTGNGDGHSCGLNWYKNLLEKYKILNIIVNLQNFEDKLIWPTGDACYEDLTIYIVFKTDSSISYIWFPLLFVLCNKYKYQITQI